MINLNDYNIGDRLKVTAIDDEVFNGVLIDFADTFYEDPENGVVIEVTKNNIVVLFLSEIKEINIVPKQK